MSDNHTLAVFPNISIDGECWRFLQYDGDLAVQDLVVTGQGIEDDEDEEA